MLEYKIRVMGIHIRRKKIKVLRELLRKSWHFFAGIAMLIVYSLAVLYLGKELSLVILVFVLLMIMLFEHVRLEYRPKVLKLVDVLFRKKEFNKPSSMMSFMLAGVIVFAVFDYWIAFTAMMMMVVGDSLSAGAGMMFGKRKIRRDKTYVGSFAGLIANLFAGAVIMWEYPLVFVPMALTATIIETLTNKLDDNLTVPITTAFVGFVITILFHISLTM
ncbi:MAG: hypothetical protein KKI14_04335 [Nanoarchaeota archaeon]|nr:hypothetical protein [Nanoarchaeota archaeon]